MKKTVLSILIIWLLVASGYIARGYHERLKASEATETTETTPESAAQSLSRTKLVSLYDVARLNERKRSGVARRAFDEGVVPTVWRAGEEPALRRESLWLDDIALAELYMDDGREKPLLLFLHGLGQDKESSLAAAEAYAKAGWYVVCLDAFYQGERSPEAAYCDFWAAVSLTVADIDHVLDYYDTQASVSAERLVLAGYSMGAVEAWAYAISGEREPAALISLCGIGESACWQDWVRELLPYMWLKAWAGLVWAFPEQQTADYTAFKQSYIAALDASNNADALAGLPIFCAVGTQDKYFSADRAAATMESLAASGVSVSFCRYEDAAHAVSSAMIDDSLAFLRQYLP